MRKFLLLFLLPASQAFSQTTYRLELVAEGNFGTPNGDVFVRNTTITPATTSTGMYQTANSAAGFDVLQDFVIAGNKAVFAEKPSGAGRIAIVDYPSMNLVQTFAQAPQTLGVASSTKVYACYAQGGIVSLVNLEDNTLTPVVEPNNEISSYCSHMQFANGFMYLDQGGDLVKIDTITNTVVAKFNVGVGLIAGIAYDNQGKLWVIGGTSINTVDVLNNDAVGSAINIGLSAKLLRYYNNNLYFWTLSDKKLYKYDVVNTPTLPLNSVYTSTLPGNSWSFGYGRSFDIDQNTGDFAIATANNYTAPGYFEVVDGTSFTVIESTSIPGCAIPNKCFVKTFHQPVGSAPVPDLATLPEVNEECSVTLTPPTADNGNVTATTTNPVSYDEQGTFTVTWTYTNTHGTTTQTQEITIEDVTNPVATVNSTTVECGETVTTPVATDNCAGTINGTTNDPVSFSTAGNFVINWTFDDGNGNSTSAAQQVTVNCTVGLEDQELHFSVYPNPANTTLYIVGSIENENYTITDINGRPIAAVQAINQSLDVDVRSLTNGVYILTNGKSVVRFSVVH